MAPPKKRVNLTEKNKGVCCDLLKKEKKIVKVKEVNKCIMASTLLTQFSLSEASLKKSLYCLKHSVETV